MHSDNKSRNIISKHFTRCFSLVGLGLDQDHNEPCCSSAFVLALARPCDCVWALALAGVVALGFKFKLKLKLVAFERTGYFEEHVVRDGSQTTTNNITRSQSHLLRNRLRPPPLCLLLNHHRCRTTFRKPRRSGPKPSARQPPPPRPPMGIPTARSTTCCLCSRIHRVHFTLATFVSTR